VEVLQNDENYSIILYDVGFEPPYWDATRLPPFFTMNLKSIEDVEEYLLEEQSIQVSGWQIVSIPFVEVSNAVIRDEIRYDLTSDDKYKSLVGRYIPLDVFMEAMKYFIEKRNEYGGHSVYAQILFQKDRFEFPFPFLSTAEKETSTPSLLSYENVGAFIPASSSANTRNPELVGKDRMIIKGTDDDTSYGCSGSADEEPYCTVYDQETRTYLSEGKAIRIKLNFINKEESFVIDREGFEKKQIIEDFNWSTIGID